MFISCTISTFVNSQLNTVLLSFTVLFVFLSIWPFTLIMVYRRVFFPQTSFVGHINHNDECLHQTLTPNPTPNPGGCWVGFFAKLVWGKNCMVFRPWTNFCTQNFTKMYLLLPLHAKFSIIWTALCMQKFAEQCDRIFKTSAKKKLVNYNIQKYQPSNMTNTAPTLQ